MIDRLSELNPRTDIEMQPLSPNSEEEENLKSFFETVNEIRSGIDFVGEGTENIRKKHKMIMTEVRSEEIKRLKCEADLIVKECTNRANQVRKLLKAMDKTLKKLSESVDPSSADLRMRTTQKTQLTKKFLDTMNDFQNMQVEHKDKQRQQLQRQFLIVRPQATSQELENLVDNENGQQMLQQVFSLTSKQEAREQLEDMKSRHQDIVSIEKNILELHQLFLDMSILVEQQGDMIDQIDKHVEMAGNYTGLAAVQLVKAVKSQKNAMRRKWCILTVLFIIFAILIVVLIITSGK